MEREVREQPEVLSANAERYYRELSERFSGKAFDMVLLAARGTSDNAALYARYLIEVYLGIPVSLAAPSVLTRYGTRVRYSNCLAIGISQSGAAPDVAEVLESLQEDGHHTLAITNTPQSRLTEVANASLLLEAGEEKSVAATKTYTASLLACYQLVRALGGKLPDPKPNLPIRPRLELAEETATQSLGVLLRSNTLFALARGFGFCTAQETSLKMMECALLSCASYSTADFQHGPRALATFGSAAIAYGESKLNLDGTGCAVVRAPESPDEPLSPIGDIYFGQWLALLAARARGLDPDSPQNLQKVTRTL